MNPIALVAILCLAYSVAGYGCLTDGILEYELFGELPEPHKEVLRNSLKKNFDDRDLLVDYKVDEDFYPATRIYFPSVILSRLRENKRPTYFMHKMGEKSVTEIEPYEFIDPLYTCRPFEY